jgi:GAF domain-containing protein
VSIDIKDRKLVELSDRFRDAEDTTEVTTITAELLGRTLQLGRPGYGSMDPTGTYINIESDWTASNIFSVVGHHQFADYNSFANDLRQGEPVIIDDVELDPRTGSDLVRLRSTGPSGQNATDDPPRLAD